MASAVSARLPQANAIQTTELGLGGQDSVALNCIYTKEATPESGKNCPSRDRTGCKAQAVRDFFNAVLATSFDVGWNADCILHASIMQ
ncbi:MAG TPA: hypothetical protein DF427_02240 [Moraxellaceae bacterium]|nr:hypothetical protein [Moraxellaceae bacterium]